MHMSLQNKVLKFILTKNDSYNPLIILFPIFFPVNEHDHASSAQEGAPLRLGGAYLHASIGRGGLWRGG
jgi:hypothetical protein